MPMAESATKTASLLYESAATLLGKIFSGTVAISLVLGLAFESPESIVKTLVAALTGIPGPQSEVKTRSSGHIQSR